MKEEEKVESLGSKSQNVIWALLGAILLISMAVFFVIGWQNEIGLFFQELQELATAMFTGLGLLLTIAIIILIFRKSKSCKKK